jgi:hypothetical protein
MKKVSGVPDGELVVSMVIHHGRVLVATNKHVYVQGDDFVMRLVVFETEEKKAAPFESFELMTKEEFDLRAKRGGV